MPKSSSRRLASWLTVVLVIVGAPLATAGAAQAATAWPSVQDSSSRSANVVTLQYLLNAHGIATKVDSDFGPGTLTSVKTFQTRKGLRADGVVGPATWGKIVTPIGPGAVNKNSVMALQIQLNKYRFGLVVDGSYGPGTKAAVVRFQELRGLSQTGSATADTWRELLGYSQIHDQVACYYYPGTTYSRLLLTQVENAKVIISTGKRLGVPRNGQIIALMTAMQESKLCNVGFGDRDSIGLFQQRPSQGWCNDRVGCWGFTNSTLGFYGRSQYTDNRGLLDISGWQSMAKWRAAQAVQGSGEPTAYAQWESISTSLVNAHG